MTIRFDQLFLLGVFTTALHWLIARSDIARPVWSRARGWVAKLLACPACSGFWLGGASIWVGIQPFGPVFDGPLWQTIAKTQLAGIAAMVITPVFEGIMVWGLRESAIAETESPAEILTDPALTESGDKTPNQRPPMI